MPPAKTLQTNKLGAVIDQVGRYFVGRRDILEKLLAAALANGHVLFEDYPGLGKTLLVKVFAASLGVRSRRIQFTPDVLPADILGTKIWNQEKRTFEMFRGPIFTNIVLADEINRAPPKTQSALLEAMEERQVTLEGQTLSIPPPFCVFATQNPIEQEGTYPLPEAQMDRFLMRLSTGYPADQKAESEVLRRRIGWKKEDPTASIKPAISEEELVTLQQLVENDVFIHEALLDYITSLVRGLRDHPKVEIGPSPRGSLALLRVSRALALIRGRTFVIPDDILDVAPDILAHRTILEVDQVLEGVRAANVVQEVVQTLPLPVRSAIER
jgi:MoxR-like ATPase